MWGSPWGPQALGMQGQKDGEQVGRASPWPGRLRQGHRHHGQPGLGSLTAVQQLQSEPTLEKEVSAENLDVLAHCRQPIPWAARGTGSKWTLLSLRPRLPATECAAQILISGAPGTSPQQGEHPLSFDSKGGPKAQSLLTRHHARVLLLPPNNPRGSLPWPISVSWPLRPRGRSPPNVI